MSNLTPSNKKEPCRVCGDTKGKCRVSQDGQLLQCMNSDQAPDGFVRIGGTKDGLWHQFRAIQESQHATSARPKETPKMTSELLADDRDRYYRRMFEELKLEDVDRADLERRGYTRDQIRWSSVVSVQQWHQLKGQYPETLPGILSGNKLNVQPGMLIPVRDVEGRIVACQLRLREPGDGGRYRWVTSATKKNPDGATPHIQGELPLAVHRPVDVKVQAIGLCEGTGAKPFLACHRLEMVVVGASGGLFGSSFNTLKRTLNKLCKELGTKEVVFFPDAGAVKNPQIIKTLRATFDAVQKLGFDLKIAWWGQFQKGTDPDIDELTDLSQIKLLTLAEFLEIAGADAAEFFNRQENKPRGSKLASDIARFSELFGDRLKLNELTGFYEFDGKQVSVEELELILALDFDIDPPKNFEKIVCAIAKRYHPVRVYLERCYLEHGQAVDPDAVLGNFAERYFGCSEPIYQEMMRRWFIGTARRVFEPGCQRDEVLILQGRQGYRKSSFFRTISNGWFDDSIGTLSDKDEKLKLHRSWIIEWAEIESVFRRKDISAVKAQITCPIDLLRPPYGRSIVEMKRSCTIVGSTNEAQFLGDPTGNRRYWVVPVRKKIDTDLLEAERELLWAAAVKLYMQDEPHWLDDQLQSAANQLTEQYEHSHPWEFSVLSYVSNRSHTTVREILEHVIGKDLRDQTRADEMIVTDILKRAGWEQGKRQIVNGVRIRTWICPQEPPFADEPHAEPGKSAETVSDPTVEAPQPNISEPQPWAPEIGRSALAYFDGNWHRGTITAAPPTASSWTVQLSDGQKLIQVFHSDRLLDPSVKNGQVV